jgi:glutamyl-tRNA reductase
MTLVAVSLSHTTAPVALRERVQVGEHRAPALLASLTEHAEIDGAASLSTCGRTELYLAARDADAARTIATAELAMTAGMDPGDLAAAVHGLHGIEVARHLFRVAAGLDSIVLGEAEIQGQVRRSYELALSLRTSGPIVNRLFQGALRAGKRVRSETSIGRRRASVASVAVELARRELGDLDGRRALVIGAGKHGALTARALTDAGVEAVYVASRAHDRAEDLARRFGGTAVNFDSLARELRACDLVLTCTSCPHRIRTQDDLAAAARGRTLVVMDTAVPRDVEPSARELPGIRLFDLDAIEREVARNLSARADGAVMAAPIIEEEVASFERWLASLDVVPTISALRERGRAAVARALRADEPHWQSLPEEERRRMELIAGAVISDLLHQPTLTLRRAGEQGTSSRYVEAVRELFGLSV